MIRAVAVAVAAGLSACGGAPHKEPAPEFDDLDVDRRGPARVVGTPVIINAERLPAVLEGLPYETTQRGVIDGSTLWAHKVLRRAREGEWGGIVEYVDMKITKKGSTFRFVGSSHFAAEPPHRLLGVAGTERADGMTRQLVYRNGPEAMVINIRDDGVAQPPIRRPPSRSTVAKLAAIYVDPELLRVGAMQNFNVFRAQNQRDMVVRLKVVDRGAVDREGEKLATVTFEQDVEGAITTWVVAGGRHLIQYGSGSDRTAPVR